MTFWLFEDAGPAGMIHRKRLRLPIDFPLEKDPDWLTRRFASILEDRAISEGARLKRYRFIVARSLCGAAL